MYIMHFNRSHQDVFLPESCDIALIYIYKLCEALVNLCCFFTKKEEWLWFKTV